MRSDALVLHDTWLVACVSPGCVWAPRRFWVSFARHYLTIAANHSMPYCRARPCLPAPHPHLFRSSFLFPSESFPTFLRILPYLPPPPSNPSLPSLPSSPSESFPTLLLLRCRRVEDDETCATFPFNSCGTAAYVAPEALVSSKKVSHQVTHSGDKRVTLFLRRLARVTPVREGLGQLLCVLAACLGCRAVQLEYSQWF